MAGRKHNFRTNLMSHDVFLMLLLEGFTCHVVLESVVVIFASLSTSNMRNYWQCVFFFFAIPQILIHWHQHGVFFLWWMFPRSKTQLSVYLATCTSGLGSCQVAQLREWVELWDYTDKSLLFYSHSRRRVSEHSLTYCVTQAKIFYSLRS